MKLLLITSLLMMLIGCANANKPAFYWGNYSSTLYKLKTTPNDVSFQEHISQLEKIIEKSTSKSLDVPPGVHAELGYRYASLERTSDAMNQYQAEIELYPESVVFVEKLKLQLIEQSQGDKQ
jgi:hypothetical protein